MAKKEIRYPPPPDDESADEQKNPEIRYHPELLKISEIFIRHKRLSSFEKFTGSFGAYCA